MKIWIIIALTCTIWVLYDCIVVNKGLSTKAKVLWILGAIIFPVLVALLYFLKEKKRLF